MFSNAPAVLAHRYSNTVHNNEVRDHDMAFLHLTKHSSTIRSGLIPRIKYHSTPRRFSIPPRHLRIRSPDRGSPTGGISTLIPRALLARAPTSHTMAPKPPSNQTRVAPCRARHMAPRVAWSSSSPKRTKRQ
ncbi:Os03g0766700 [Oryza sativa Japonica Group]|uniref:Os03g0766700 protein n=1 Tax=Oryza sativa subsp. japonica TaxID=39947 RepID=A0A0P0W3I9_ORYSJ|nr:Os03g0766700 [Oryza sativa Japonica Group]